MGYNVLSVAGPVEKIVDVIVVDNFFLKKVGTGIRRFDHANALGEVLSYPAL
jgi:hypothetical protein